ncbi:unnamed protein product [Cochlearia groenlandica]
MNLQEVEEPLEKKQRRKKTTENLSTSFSLLPHEIAENCLSRVSRFLWNPPSLLATRSMYSADRSMEKGPPLYRSLIVAVTLRETHLT